MTRRKRNKFKEKAYVLEQINYNKIDHGVSTLEKLYIHCGKKYIGQ